LTGTGIRGLRYAKEINGIKKVFLNDKNPSAIRLVKKNIKENKIKNCVTSNEDASVLMRNNVFVVIDLDPFGSPSIFMDSAARSVYHKGFLCVTATDQSALAGTYPESCLRKYGIRSVKTEFYNELGVRILITFTILSLARYDKAFMPMLSFSTRQYYKVFGRIEHAGKISGLLKDFGYVNYCPVCGDRTFGKVEKADSNNHTFINCGPVYLGKINDKAFCESVLEDIKKRDFGMKKEETKMLDMLIEEADMPALFYDIHYLSKKLKRSTPNFEALSKNLRERGYKISRTHFCLTALKTDADYKTLKENL
jgi:tRNA (guanine26-N2/guanine27-N2)-dimethyltransferase